MVLIWGSDRIVQLGAHWEGWLYPLLREVGMGWWLGGPVFVRSRRGRELEDPVSSPCSARWRECWGA